jgi:hypothetical protein
MINLTPIEAWICSIVIIAAFILLPRYSWRNHKEDKRRENGV